jgi:hypothetical protein
MGTRAVRALCCATLIVVAACGGPRFGDIAGTVKYQGKPVAGGTITFFDAGKGAVSSPILADGSYSVKRVRFGQAKIAVFSPMAIGFKGLGGTMEPVAGAAPPIPLPAKYNDPNQSGLTCDVRSVNQNHDVSLD